MNPQSNLTTYVALLRGVNVGGHGLVSMADLRSCFEAIGFQNVSTYINSGNVIFKDSRSDSSKLVPLIEAGVKKRCTLDVRVVVKSAKDLAAICRKIPQDWVTDKFMRTEVMFVREDADTRQMLDAIVTNPQVDRLLRVKGAVIWNINRKDYGKSKLPKIVGTAVYKKMTGRNANTTRKLLELMNENQGR